VKSFTTTAKVTAEDIDNILCGAFEGGSNYWISEVIVTRPVKDAKYASEVISKGGELKIIEDEDDSEHTLTLEKMLKGIGLNRNYNFDDMDATDYDNILQYALFGKLIYG
jgi:hypothetical protein